MTSKLSSLLRDIDVLEIIGETDKNITSLESDSRKVEKDALFVAVKGVTNDGHKYIPVVASAHVAAIVCEEMPAAYEKGITYIRVADSAEALGRLASAWHGHPSRKLKLVGVTGTNGKTTTATLLYEMAKFEGFKAGLLSTVCNYVVDRAVPTTHTTPDPLTLNSTAQKRVAGLNFAGGIFTNLTRDHLDCAVIVENYMKAKKAFFDMLPADAFALTNADDKCGMYMVQNTKAKVYTYSLRSDADFKGKVLETRLGDRQHEPPGACGRAFPAVPVARRSCGNR